MARIKGIIFDLNGTILWDTAYHNKAWNIFLEKYNINISEQEIRDNMHGKTNAEIMKYLFKQDLTLEEINKLASEKEKIYRTLVIEDNLQLANGVEKLFNYCLETSIPTSIATSSDQENSEFYYQRYNLKKWFMPCRYIYNNYTFKSKPNPEIFIKAANSMLLDPNEVLVFEDSIAGITTAENFGAGKIIIINSTGDDYSKYPYEMLTDFNEALDIIKNNITVPRENTYLGKL
ncbi:MAG: HAD family phosphatase [Bacteroidales bacterium]|nr:HAD family phosphatase [Bacteroidales bacterium]